MSTSPIENTNVYGVLGLLIPLHLLRNYHLQIMMVGSPLAQGTKLFWLDKYTYKVYYFINII